MSNPRDKQVEIFFHGMDNPHHADVSCQYAHWMGYDLTHVPGVGEWKCKLQEERWGDLLYGGGNENLDYLPCTTPNHMACPIYQKVHHDEKNQ